MQLRRKVLNRIKPKSLNGKPLSGAMLATLAESYTKSINGGAVPNIENAWSYICQNECGKALHESIETFEEILGAKGYSRVPLEEDELKDVYAEAKREAMAIYKKKAIGNQGTELIRDLKEKIKFKYQDLKEENERQSAQYCTSFLIDSYQCIDAKLKGKEFPSFSEYEQELE